MLKIFNDLEPFFRDNYTRINVREYSRKKNISPPTASVLLSNLEKEKILKKEEDRNYIFYFANKESKIFIDLSRAYWFLQIKKSGLIDHLEKELVDPLIILFGSFSKAEIKQDSDIDLVIFTASSKKINLKVFEKRLGRKIQFFLYTAKEEVKSKELLNNMTNGYILSGSW